MTTEFVKYHDISIYETKKEGAKRRKRGETHDSASANTHGNMQEPAGRLEDFVRQPGRGEGGGPKKI